MSIPSNLDPLRIPRHVAIVMDGNGRWAVERHKPRLFGHKAGVDTVKEIVEVARDLGVQVLTLYAFSSENWKRPVEEVGGLMSLLKSYLLAELTRMLDNDIRLVTIGDRKKLPDNVQQVLNETIEKTINNRKLILNLALSYGGRDELARAITKIADSCVAKEIKPADIDESLVTSSLDTAGLPDPDLLIRTGGEERLSNFLLWQASYAELYFTDTKWPDFRRDAFISAIENYQNRERRFGKTGKQVKAEA